MITQDLLNQDAAPKIFRDVAFAMFGVREQDEGDDKYANLKREDDIFDQKPTEDEEEMLSCEETLNKYDLSRAEIEQQKKNYPH